MRKSRKKGKDSPKSHKPKDSKFRSIRKKILMRMSLTVLVALLLTCSVSSILNYRSTLELLDHTMGETAHVASEMVSHQINRYIDVTSEVGAIPKLSSDATPQEKQGLIDLRVASYGFVTGGVVAANGIEINTGQNFSQQACFQAAMSGQSLMTPPEVGSDGKIFMLITAPLWADGDTTSYPVGMVYFVPESTFLNDIVASIQVSDGGSAYMINSEGYTIAHKNMDGVINKENTQEDAKTDPQLKDLAAMEAAMTQGQRGFGTYTYGGVSKLMAYAPVAETDGWSIAITAPMSDFLGSTIQTVVISVILTVVALIVSILIASNLASGIGKPLSACAERLVALSKGDLHSPMPQVKDSRDEVSVLISASSELQNDMREIISDISYVMEEMSKGNFTVRTKDAAAYVGDYQGMLVSIRGLRDTMGDTLRQISDAADQVEVGSKQLATGSQTLSQGTVDQASSTEDLASAIGEINHHIHETGQFADEARIKTGQAGDLMNRCTSQMEDMLSAMSEISRSSQEIGKIIKTIEDIAFQTNILALNAAVEAARAGTAGKGFAVVADEVRNLAAKSAEASQDTAELIEASVAAVKKGVSLANGTAEQMTGAAQSTQEILGIVTKIDNNTREQAASMERISSNVDQISSVVHNNSATAEESAAASQQLSGQANLLRQLVKRFVVEEKGAYR